ncbi:MAG: class IV adenylate cyclase [Candidatus Latescibacteria bacterium]|jgi:adenylate cyclase, class 2|nr:class IV adenylate cyclase [Candidatus Latescibacterota bacterium]
MASNHTPGKNIEIKARISGFDRIRVFLSEHNADFKGTDHQIDTYFKVPHGRLKIREGTIESCLVFYNRDNRPGPKRCDYIIEQFKQGDAMPGRIRAVLESSLGILTIVDKKREIFFIDNVKFHLDTVKNLGTFFEIEAIDTGAIDEEHLHRQCEEYLEKLGITEKQLVGVSYSDMLLDGS